MNMKSCTNFQTHISIFDRMQHPINFWSVKGKNGSKTNDNVQFFKIGLIYSPKNGNAYTKCLIHHLGGYFARFLASVLRFGRSKSHFLSLEKGHFLQTWTPNSTVHCKPWTIGHCVWLTYEDLIYPWFSSTATSTPRSVFCRPQVFLRKTQDLVCDSRHT